MGGVDGLDSILEYYRMFQKTRKWTVTVFQLFINLVVVKPGGNIRMIVPVEKSNPEICVDLADALINCVNVPQYAFKDEESLFLVDRPFNKYRPAVSPSFDKQYDKCNHLPVFDDLSRGKNAG